MEELVDLIATDAATIFGGEAHEDEVVDELDNEDEQEHADEQPTEEDYE